MRDRYTAFIDRHETTWELTMAALAIAYVVTGFAADEPGTGLVYGLIEFVLTTVFVTEFVTRFAASRHRMAYLHGHWIDLVALVPTVRGLRIARLLRLLRLVRAFAGVFRAISHIERLAHHRGLAWLIVVWLGIMVLSSLGLYAAENGVNEAVTSPLDALWWGIVTLTTVGYGDVYPVTLEGRLAAAVLMLLGIGVFSVITATVTSYLVSTNTAERDPAHRLRDLRALHDEGLVTESEYEERRARLVHDL